MENGTCCLFFDGSIMLMTFVRQRFVEYYDSRACIAAYDACQGQPYGDGIWDVSFFWDHTTK